MKLYSRPNKGKWAELVQRPVINAEELTQKVEDILIDVKQNGDQAVFRYASMFDGVELNSLSVSKNEISNAVELVPQALKNAIQLAYKNILSFHKAQQIEEKPIETSPGVRCWRRSVAIEKVGLYIPGGTAPLFSTILMLGAPAQIAGCTELILCTPPAKDGKINAAILYTAKLVGISKIYKVGGAQAIAAMAYGTASIPKVYKIFGPGNQYVTKAKELVQQGGVSIDLPAGPSEVLVIASDHCNPEFVAADLLSQAEHGADSQVILLSDNERIIQQCMIEIKKQVELLPRKQAALGSLLNSKAVLFDSIDECFDFSNQYAPEHLILAIENASQAMSKIINAGSVFLGNYSCESAGDYASGTNHTLPTNGFAKSHSGVSLDSFVKKITFQELTKEGICNIGNAIEMMAEAEGLWAHKNAVSVRLKEINND